MNTDNLENLSRTISIQQTLMEHQSLELKALKIQNKALEQSNDLLKKYLGFEKYYLQDSMLDELSNNDFIVYLLNNFKYYNFERMKELDEDCGFETYSDFIKYNKQKFAEMSNDKKRFLLDLTQIIDSKNVKIGSNEYFNIWRANVVYINKNNKICINHPR